MQKPELSNVLPLKPGAGQNIAMMLHPLPRISSLEIVYLPSPFNFIFPRSSLHVFLAFSVVNAGSGVSLQNKMGHPALCHKQLIQIPVLSVHGT